MELASARSVQKLIWKSLTGDLDDVSGEMHAQCNTVCLLSNDTNNSNVELSHNKAQFKLAPLYYMQVNILGLIIIERHSKIVDLKLMLLIEINCFSCVYLMKLLVT